MATISAERAPAVSAKEFSIADPAPLGLAAFAATTFFLSVVNTGMLTSAVVGGVLGLTLFYGGIAQLLAGMWEFVRGNTFGALAFSSYGAFWLSYWYLVVHVVPGWTAAKVPASEVNHSIALFLLVWAIFTIYMVIPAMHHSMVLTAVFVMLAATFVALAIGHFAGTPDVSWIKLGGWTGIVTALLGWYASLAGVANDAAKRVVFPTFPTGPR